jgi:FixJ family two-component response regulator
MDTNLPISVALIDDDESVRRSLERLLRAAGMQSFAYPSAEIFLADDHRPHLDCLLLDVQLEGLSGIELRSQLIASGDRTPVIFITAHDEPGTRKQALAMGCAAYFRKTDPGHAVLAAIRQAVANPAGDQ